MLSLRANQAAVAADAHGDRPVKHAPLIGLFAVTAMLASCNRAEDKVQIAAATAAIGPERAGPTRWNPEAGGFEFDGKPAKSARSWTFDGSTDGFTGVNSKIVPTPGDGGITLDVVDPTIRSPKGLKIPGGLYTLVLVRLTRTKAASAPAWDGTLYYSTASHGEVAADIGKPISGIDPHVGETTTLVYDMGHQTQGAPDWTQSMIDQIRIDIEDKAGGTFVIRQVAITKNPDAPPPKS